MHRRETDILHRSNDRMCKRWIVEFDVKTESASAKLLLLVSSSLNVKWGHCNSQSCLVLLTNS